MYKRVTIRPNPMGEKSVKKLHGSLLNWKCHTLKTHNCRVTVAEVWAQFYPEMDSDKLNIFSENH